MWKTPTVNTTTKGRSLRSEQRDDVWKDNLGELSPDSRELFEDLEEAERDQDSFSSSLKMPALSSSSRMDFNMSTPRDFIISRVEDVDSAPRMRKTREPDHRNERRMLFSSPDTPLGLVSTPPSICLPLNNQREAVGNDHQQEMAVEEVAEFSTGDSAAGSDQGFLDSEALAMQLMEEEQAMFLQRIEEEQMMMIARMQAGGDGDDDLAMAIRMAAEGGHADDEEAVDPDGLSYDQLLELGERIGDVKQERWRMDCVQHISTLETTIYSADTIVSDATCVVCQYEFECGDQLKKLPCGHLFHNECIDPWLKDHDTCVTCKKSIIIKSSP